MIQQMCNKEQAVVAALQSGNLDGDLLVHAESCAICGEIVITQGALRHEAASLETSAHPPDPAIIWRRAQQRSREEALARATLPIRITLACTVVVSILSAPWLVGYFLRLSWEWPSPRSLSFLEGNWLGALSGTTVIGMIATLLCIALSSWFVLREE